MLPEERYAAILERIKHNRIVTVHELVLALDSSAPTIRRDLTVLQNKGLLQKVHGGATSIDASYTATEADKVAKAYVNRDAKQSIALSASKLIGDNGLIYIDAGTTTEMVLHYLPFTSATFVTNAIEHASYLSSRHLKVILLGGNVKHTPAAVVGNITLEQLDAFNFTQGFFGTDGISFSAGFTTPDPLEAAIKRKAMQKSRSAYVLADPSKFDRVAPVTFGPLTSASIITTKLPNDLYREHTIIQEVLRR